MYRILYKWFLKKQKEKFEKSVIASECKGASVSGLFSQNDIQSVHHIEKLSQCFKKRSIVGVTQNLRDLALWMTKSEQFMVLTTICYRLNIQTLRLTVHGGMNGTVLDVVTMLFNFINTNQHLATFSRNQRMSAAKPSFQERDRSQEPDVIIDKIAEQSRSEAAWCDNSVGCSTSNLDQNTDKSMEGVRFSDPWKDL